MKEIINGLRQLLTPRDKWCMLGITIMLSAGAILEIIGLGLVMPIIAIFSKPELLEQNKCLRIFRGFFPAGNDTPFLLICCVLLVLLYIIKNLWIFVTIKIYSSFVFSRLSAISCRVYSGFLQCPHTVFVRHGKAGLHNIINKIEVMCSYVLIPSMTIFVDSLSVIFITAVLAVTIPGVVLGCLVIFIIGSACIYLPLRKINSVVGNGMSSSWDELNKLTLYSLEDVKTIKVLGIENYFLTRFKSIREEKSRFSAIFYTIGQIPRLALETIAIFSAVAILMFMIWRGEAIGTVILSFSLLIAAMSRMLPAFSRISYSVNTIKSGIVFFKEIISSLEWQREYLGDPDQSFEFKHEIRIKNLEFTYPDSGRKIFSDLNLTLRHNESLAVTGPTGSGKSTFIDLLLGLYRPDSGSIEVDGRNIFDSLGAWRKQIGFVPQHIVLADDTIAANVALGVPEEKIDRDRVAEVLQIAQLKEFVDSLPDGIDSAVGDNGMLLSGGQRQRIGIARALYRNPEIIIFDEATSALDPETEQALIDAMETLHGQKTLIMIAHRLSTVEKCEKQLEIKSEVSGS